MPRSYKPEDLLDNAVCEETAFLKKVERFSLEKVILI
jgi:hypothetical protein